MGERRRYLFGILPMSTADETPSKSVFGAPLAEAVLESGMPSASSGGLIPAVVQRCIEFLEGTDAMQEEGIYRVSGSSTGIKQLQERFIMYGDVDLLAELHSTSKQRLGPWHDTHAVAGLLKLYLRILPENLCTETSLGQFSKSAEIQDREERCTAINSLMEEIPSENFALMEALFSHLNHVQQLSAKNKMSPQNLGIVFSATLNMPVDLVVAFVSDYDAIFRSESAVPTALAVERKLQEQAKAMAAERADALKRKTKRPKKNVTLLSFGSEEDAPLEKRSKKPMSSHDLLEDKRLNKNVSKPARVSDTLGLIDSLREKTRDQPTLPKELSNASREISSASIWGDDEDMHEYGAEEDDDVNWRSHKYSH
ncbi:Rho GTPase activating protein [Malassezia equina]|uniref:Rho GTPase activating protein n=1 Tax=Malassezia equina TaxID=1381935 RepID=A0AAF0IYX9_9BASI|nr:Rho GTPase activating protein [Malassezia equina]